MGTEATCMHHALRDALMVEVEDLLAEVEILQRGGTAGTDPERILIVGNGGSLLRGQDRDFTARGLVRFSAFGLGTIFV